MMSDTIHDRSSGGGEQCVPLAYDHLASRIAGMGKACGTTALVPEAG